MNKLVRHTIQPAGRIKRIAAALLVDDAVRSSSRKAVSGRRAPKTHRRGNEAD